MCIYIYIYLFIYMYFPGACTVPVLSALNFALVSNDRRSDESARTFMEAVVA
jgi:hypothetical protein